MPQLLYFAAFTALLLSPHLLHALTQTDIRRQVVARDLQRC